MLDIRPIVKDCFCKFITLNFMFHWGFTQVSTYMYAFIALLVLLLLNNSQEKDDFTFSLQTVLIDAHYSSSDCFDLFLELTEEEIVAQSFLVFVAGYETTATLLTYVSYVLAIYPEIQDKLIAEIDNCTSEVAVHSCCIYFYIYELHCI